MPRRKSSASFTPHYDFGEKSKILCGREGCTQEGEFRAPTSRQRPGEYQMLCAEHITEFNKKWDYFAGMPPEEIEAFQREAMFGHRPTWRPDGRYATKEAQLYDALYDFIDIAPARTQVPRIPKAQRDALAQMDLEHPITKTAIKRQYKKLVKLHHPDVNRTNPKAEEIFKAITSAYRLLMEEYEEAI